MENDYKRAYEECLKQNTALHSKIQTLEKSVNEAMDRISTHIDKLNDLVGDAYAEATQIIEEKFKGIVSDVLLKEALEELQLNEPYRVALDAEKKDKVRL